MVERVKDQGIVVSVTDHEGDDSAVTQIKDRTQIDLVNLNAIIPFEFCYICCPLLVWFLSVELSIQEIIGYVLRVIGLPGTSIVAILDRRLNTPFPTDTKHALIVDCQAVVDFQIIPKSTVSFIRALHVYLLQLVRNLLILLLPRRQSSTVPLIIGRSGDMQHATSLADWITGRLDCLVKIRLPYLR